MSDIANEEYRKADSISQYAGSGWNREMVGQCMLFWRAFPPEGYGDKIPNHGFEFDCIRLNAGWNFDDPAAEFETVAKGVAYFDGVRHINFHCEDGSDLYYPEMESLVKLMTRLYQLEGQYCWDAPQNRGKKR